MKKLYYLLAVFISLSSFAQTTYDFTTDATIVSGSPWNTEATITIGGVAYKLTSGGNGSFSNIGSGGESNSKCLRKDGSGGDSFTLQRVDGQPFQFYGMWVNQQGMNSYSTLITLPPWYTLTAGSYTYNDMTPMTPGTAWNNYTYSSTAITTGAGGVNVSSVSINFNAIVYYAIDNIIVGTAISPNTAPTNISLSATSVNENVAANSNVGTLTSTDANSGDTFTYTLVSGTGSTDNSSFNISGSNLRISSSPDFETKNSYAIRLRTTDQGSLNYEKQFTITINDLNESPTDISLSANSLNENVAANTTVGTLTTTDVDAGGTFTYSLVSGTGSTDNASFNISGNSLRITNSPDFETKSSYAIRVRSTDQGSLTYEKQFTITINNLNEAPTNISLSAAAIDENVVANTVVGNFSTVDVDSGSTFTYSLVVGTGSTDNASFNISGNSLRITNSPDFETKSSYTIRVRSTDQGSLFFEKQFTITVNNLTESPATHLNFDGINDYVSISNAAGLNNLQQGTIEAWVKWSGTQDQDALTFGQDYYGAILARQKNNVFSNHILALDGANPNSAKIVWAPYGIGTPAITSTVSPMDNTWVHIAIVYTSGNHKLFINGVLNASSTTTGTMANDASIPLTIGAWIGDANCFSKSNIDEVRIWNTLRTPEQIAGSKNCELQGTESGLISYYKFNQGFDAASNPSIITLTDATSNNNNGTLTDFSLSGSTSNWLAGSAVTSGLVIPSAPSVTSPVVYNQGDTASALSATTGSGGIGLMWYTVATGGTGSTTAPIPSTATVGNTSYWVSSTNANGCESGRTEIIVTVNALVPATHLNFDGTNDGVNLGTGLTSTLSGSNFVTAEAWIFIPNTTGTKTIVGNHQASTQFNLRVINNQLNGFLGFGTYNVDSPAGSIVANTWQHVAMVYNDTTLKLYINGVEVASTNIPVGYSIIASAQPYRIGHSAFGGEYFNGSIDEVRIWNAALSQADIQATMNCEAQAQPELVAYYKFNQGFDNTTNTSVTTLTDTAGSNNGTLSGFALTGATSNWKSGSTVTTGNTCATLSADDFVATESKLTVYPNPSSGIFNLNIKENVSVEVYDMMGKMILKQNMEAGTSSIDISRLSSGVYMLKAISESSNSAKTVKIVKQ